MPTNLQRRKALLIAESEINRELLRRDIVEASQAIRQVAGRAVIVSAATWLVGSVAKWMRPTETKRSGSWLGRGISLLSTILPFWIRPQPKNSSR